MVYVDFKDLTSRTAFGKICHYKAFSIARNPKYDIYQRDLASIVYNFLIKKPLILLLKMRIFQTKN